MFDQSDTFGLLVLANEAYETLQSFTEAQDEFSRNSYTQTERAITVVEECISRVKEHLERLKSIIPLLIDRPQEIADVEETFYQTLGNYLCDILNTMNSYQRMLNVQLASYKKFSFKKAWKSWCEYRRYERQRMRSGKNLMYAYSLYNIGLHAVNFQI